MESERESLKVSDEEASDIRAKADRTAREELILAKYDAGCEDPVPGVAVPARCEKLGDDLHLVMPDGQVHEPRTIAIGRGDYDRSFWVNVIIACD